MFEMRLDLQFLNQLHGCIVSVIEFILLRRHSHLATVANMSRQYSTDLDAEGYHRRPGRSLAVDVTYQTRDSSRTHPIGSRPINTSSAAESESERGTNRRRIAVAVCCGSMSYEWIVTILVTDTHQQCSRCRKRKIKCSGDPGNGQGCNNCKTAGADIGTCQFLRV